MPGWNDILNELGQTPSQHDNVRRKYLKRLSKLTGRNVIAYYSSWLTKPNADNTDINDSDVTGFMNSIKGMDCSKGLDLILHTPGGFPTAAEAIVKYLRVKFNNDNSKNHSRHFDYQFCKEIGLNIIEMESDPKFQDAILSVHHAYMLTLAMTPTVKIIESQNGKAYIINQSAQRN